MSSRFVRRSSPVEHLDPQFEASLDEFLGRPLAVGFAATPKWSPPTDVFETEDAFYVVVELAGMTPETISIEMQGGLLTVAGVRHSRAAGKRRYHAMEIQVGPFERRIRIDQRVNAEAIQASYDRGYLELRLPKLPEPPPGPRQIPIR